MRSLTLVGCLIPLLWLFIDITFDNLGSNPIQALHIRIGDWSLRFLCLTLAITPIQTVTKWRGMTDYRQMFGLYAFFYATLHVLAYLLVDHALMWRMVGIDVIESPYIWFGVLAYLIIFSLALTSPKWAKKRMGKTWKKLHRFIHIAAVAAIVHYFWQLKGNLAEPLFYSIVVFLLLSFRILVWVKNRQFSRMMIPTGQRILAVAEKQGVMPVVIRKRR
ncbi:sulfite oxidase heme-binding subunit YedZ [Methylobacter sp.]|uniref:sulfite oxidase heme-binding subunit YedZ n=1 Tax=Methylobacter sp. TaxID=2051955 RepID=UPI00248705F8|nr:protein-methionine-sulfoxide reductase heme-binding subunit MsrQ [Methylobacter sp.]MDI1279485.1 sulfoxide reductase heme-binding subunit YedZ [Methylobacter sp.]MDI1360253.1 sulfoxide reductase heme-binding subunit YedZ [Methylobacter sp.]